MKRDYSKLEGKEVPYVDVNGDNTYIGIVAGCDYGLGISVVNKENKKDFLICFSGPDSVVMNKEYWTDKKLLEYDKEFKMIIEAIENDSLNSHLLDTADTIPSISSDSCPFNQ